jgi:hypothetical protein
MKNADGQMGRHMRIHFNPFGQVSSGMTFIPGVMKTKKYIQK